MNFAIRQWEAKEKPSEYCDTMLCSNTATVKDVFGNQWCFDCWWQHRESVTREIVDAVQRGER